MNRLIAGLAGLAIVTALVSGCAGLEFEDVEPVDEFEDTGEIMKPGPGLFSGKDGSWTIFSY